MGMGFEAQAAHSCPTQIWVPPGMFTTWLLILYINQHQICRSYETHFFLSARKCNRLNARADIDARVRACHTRAPAALVLRSATHSLREWKMRFFVLSIFDGVIMDGHPIFWVVDAGVGCCKKVRSPFHSRCDTQLKRVKTGTFLHGIQHVPN